MDAGELHANDGTAQIKAATFGGDHAHGGVLQGAGAVATERLTGFIGLPLALHRHHGEVAALIGEQQALTNGNVVPIGVHHDRQTKQQA